MTALRYSSVAFALCLVGNGALAQTPGKYDTGASDTEIKIGQTYPYSGPLSAAGEIGLPLRFRRRRHHRAAGRQGLRVERAEGGGYRRALGGLSDRLSPYLPPAS